VPRHSPHMLVERSAQHLPAVGPLPGIITCPECGLFWVKQFVPEFCTRCGTRVSIVRGEGQELMVRLIEKYKWPIRIIVCPHCGERYPETPRIIPRCFRCWHEFSTARNLGWLGRLVSSVTRGLRRHR